MTHGEVNFLTMKSFDTSGVIWLFLPLYFGYQEDIKSYTSLVAWFKCRGLDRKFIKYNCQHMYAIHTLLVAEIKVIKIYFKGWKLAIISY